MPANFTEEQRKDIRNRLIQKGYEFSRSYGIKKMKIEDLAKSCGIAKGTFYHFFASKEAFVKELIDESNRQDMASLMQLLNGREKVPLEEMIVWYRNMFTFEHDFMLFQRVEDFVWMKKHLSVDYMFHPELDKEKAWQIFSIVDGIRDDIDIGVIINFIKTIYAMTENRDTFCKESLETNIDLIFETIYRYVKK